MPAHIFRQGMNHNVRPVLHRARQRRGRNRVVHYQRNPRRMRGLRHRRQVGDIPRRIAHAFAEKRPRVLVRQSQQRLRPVVRRHANLHSAARQHVGEQRVGPAVKLRNADDVLPGFRDVCDGVKYRRAAGRNRQSARPALQRRDAAFQNRGGRIHNPRVDVSRLRQVEKRRAVPRVVKGVGHRLVYRNRNRVRGRVVVESGVNGERFGMHGFLLVPQGVMVGLEAARLQVCGVIIADCGFFCASVGCPFTLGAK